MLIQEARKWVPDYPLSSTSLQCFFSLSQHAAPQCHMESDGANVAAPAFLNSSLIFRGEKLLLKAPRVVLESNPQHEIVLE